MKLHCLSTFVKLLFFVLIIYLFCSCVPKISYKSIKTGSAPVIDGLVDDIWSEAYLDTVDGDISGEINRESINDLLVKFRCLWDTSNFYFLFEVLDDVKLNNPEMAVQYNDLVILYFTPTMKKTDLDSKYTCWTFLYGVDTMIVESSKKNNINIDFKRVDNEKGYTLEIKAPWKELGIPAKSNLRIPFNIEISDMDKRSNDGVSYGRETNMSWTPGLSGNSWARPKEYGNLIFIDPD